MNPTVTSCTMFGVFALCRAAAISSASAPDLTNWKSWRNLAGEISLGINPDAYVCGGVCREMQLGFVDVVGVLCLWMRECRFLLIHGLLNEGWLETLGKGYS